MKPDDFEQNLRRQPFREVPSDWRASILQTARAAGNDPASATLAMPGVADSGPSAKTNVWSLGWREWLWPCPQAWAGLAAIWLFIAGLNLTTPAQPTMAQQRPRAVGENEPTLAEQRRELARLLDATLTEPKTAPKPPPGPRSEVPAIAPAKA